MVPQESGFSRASPHGRHLAMSALPMASAGCRALPPGRGSVVADDGADAGELAEFQRRAIDLVESGRPVAAVAVELGISGQSIYTLRRDLAVDPKVQLHS